jgi:hypothetical protein
MTSAAQRHPQAVLPMGSRCLVLRACLQHRGVYCEGQDYVEIGVRPAISIGTTLMGSHLRGCCQRAGLSYRATSRCVPGGLPFPHTAQVC